MVLLIQWTEIRMPIWVKLSFSQRSYIMHRKRYALYIFYASQDGTIRGYTKQQFSGQSKLFATQNR